MHSLHWLLTTFLILSDANNITNADLSAATQERVPLPGVLTESPNSDILQPIDNGQPSPIQHVHESMIFQGRHPKAVSDINMDHQDDGLRHHSSRLIVRQSFLEFINDTNNGSEDVGGNNRKRSSVYFTDGRKSRRRKRNAMAFQPMEIMILGCITLTIIAMSVILYAKYKD